MSHERRYENDWVVDIPEKTDDMGMELKRMQTIAEGADHCDFRYSRRKEK